MSDLENNAHRTNLNNIAQSAIPSVEAGVDEERGTVSELAIRIRAVGGLGNLAAGGDATALAQVKALVSVAPHLGIRAQASEEAVRLGVARPELEERLGPENIWILDRTEVPATLPSEFAFASFDGGQRPSYDGGVP